VRCGSNIRARRAEAEARATPKFSGSLPVSRISDSGDGSPCCPRELLSDESERSRRRTDGCSWRKPRPARGRTAGERPLRFTQIGRVIRAARPNYMDRVQGSTRESGFSRVARHASGESRYAGQRPAILLIHQRVTREVGGICSRAVVRCACGGTGMSSAKASPGELANQTTTEPSATSAHGGP
jgi:hypothetical protein